MVFCFTKSCILNSKLKIKLYDVTVAINDKTVTLGYSLPDTATGLLLFTGHIGEGVYFSIVINHGTKWSAQGISFCASNSDISSIVYDLVNNKSITFNANDKLSLDYGYEAICILIA